MSIPLAERLRPRTLDEYIGQAHLVGQNGVFRKFLETGNVPSFILWGPPGVGKTTLAKIVATTLKRPFYTLSAVTSGVKEVREVLESARKQKFFDSKPPILFIDEIHTLAQAGSKDGEVSPADILKPYLARGELQTVGATTTDEYRRFIEKDKALEAKDKEIEELNMRLAKCDLSTSTKVAESILKTAEEGAQTITAEATVKADTIVADAQNKADELIKNAEDETAELRESNNKKAEELNVLADSIKNLLKDKLATLSDSFKAVNDAVSSAVASIDTANECIEDDEKLKELLPEYVPTLIKAEPAPEENIEAVEPIEEIEQEEVKSSLVTPELESILTDVAEQVEETPEVSQQEEEKEEIPPVANPLNFGMEGMEDLLKDIEASAPVDDEDDDIPLY